MVLDFHINCKDYAMLVPCGRNYFVGQLNLHAIALAPCASLYQTRSGGGEACIVNLGIGSDYHLDLSEGFDPQAVGASLQLPLERTALFTDSGRSAIRLALRTLELSPGNAVLVPAYICGSVLDALAVEGLRPVLYGVDAHLEVMVDQLLHGKHRAQAVLLVDYFGFASNAGCYVRQLAGQGLRIIYDCSHSLLGMPRASPLVDTYVASLRKLLPLPDGGLTLVHSKHHNVCPSPPSQSRHASVRMAAMVWKGAWLKQAMWPQPPFRDLFLHAERMLDAERDINGMSTMSSVLLQLLDVNYIVERRRANFLELLSSSPRWPESVVPLYDSLAAGVCPLGFPVIVDRRDDFRRFLIAHRIYPPVHWDLDPRVFGEFPQSLRLSRHILTLPCDQRYGSPDMRVLSDVIVQWGSRCV
jgi:acyl-CoA synthetase (AMP-forming)/AMP-acid ligase II